MISAALLWGVEELQLLKVNDVTQICGLKKIQILKKKTKIPF